jgi:hypothetical protein
MNGFSISRYELDSEGPEIFMIGSVCGGVTFWAGDSQEVSGEQATHKVEELCRGLRPKGRG